MLQNPLKIMNLQNKNNILVAKQVSYRILVPMSYISFWVHEIRNKATLIGKFKRGESGAHEAPHVALLTRAPAGITGGVHYSGAFIH